MERLKDFVKRLWRWMRRNPRYAIPGTVLVMVWLFCLPRPLFKAPFSTVLEARNGELLGARIAADGQWRFPPVENVPQKYKACVIAFEDKRFYYHPGVDPVGLGRSLVQNLRSGRVVSGGSTLTMQVIRMARNNPPRTVWQKLVEVFMATRLELTRSKSAILALYAAHAPFGGNVVGLEAATWRYFGKSPDRLTWSEAALLAVLPNSPALIHPGRNRDALLAKRNRLLEKLRGQGTLSALECELAQSEPLPDQPLPLPQWAPQLLDHLSQGSPARFSTTVDLALQERLTDILARRQFRYRGNEVHNLAAVVLDVRTGEVLAYAGNVPGAGAEHGEAVDVLRAPRSTGSILKPYLYALALESGDILPNSLLHDVPTTLGQYRPENFYETYDGAVPARRALVRSLNVPFVLLLRQYGLEKFHFNLQRLGLTTLTRPPQHYGLTLVLGGAEANLLELTNTYAGMARTLSLFYERNGKSSRNDYFPPVMLANQPRPKGNSGADLSAGAIWFTFQAMQEVERPTSAGEWELFRASQQVAWKTGTSYGFRDAWAIGVTPQYAVGVWVGNADGEGRPGLIGVDMAAPVLFEIFDALPTDGRWFDPPYDDMVQAPLCRNSGQRAGPYCTPDTTWIPESSLKAQACTYCTLLHLDAAGQFQVTSDCELPGNMQHVPWFVLPPVEEFYYKNRYPGYNSPPPFRPDCMVSEEALRQAPFQLIYPKHPTRIYVPVDLDGRLGSTVFQVAHRSPDAELFWHLDGDYLGATRTFHKMALQPGAGPHVLTLVDRDGHRLEQRFEIISKRD